MKNDCSAFEYFSALADQCAAQDAENKRNQKIEQEDLALTFLSGSTQFATDTQAIEAIIPVHFLCPLPIHHFAIAGMSHYHNQVFPVIDLKILFGEQSRQMAPASRIIVYRHYEQAFGLLICQCLGLKRFQSAQIESSNIDKELLYANFVSQSFVDQKNHWPILDIDKLLDETFSGILG